MKLAFSTNAFTRFTLLEAIRANDLPVIRAAVLIVGIAFVFINLGIDMLYGVIDPRIRFT